MLGCCLRGLIYLPEIDCSCAILHLQLFSYSIGLPNAINASSVVPCPEHVGESSHPLPSSFVSSGPGGGLWNLLDLEATMSAEVPPGMLRYTRPMLVQHPCQTLSVSLQRFSSGTDAWWVFWGANIRSLNFGFSEGNCVRRGFSAR